MARRQQHFLRVASGIVGASLLLASCAESLVDINRNDIAAVNLEQGIHRRTASMGDLGTLRYTVAVPRLVSGKQYPLVIALHGAGPVVPFMSEGYLKGQAEPGLRELGAIIVAPDIPAASWLEPESEELITELVELIIELDRSWPIDPARIAVTGYSAGGIGAWFFTDRHPDLFSAGIPVAARPLVGDRSGSGASPLFVIHGAQDELFDVAEVETAVVEIRSRGVDVTLLVEPDYTHSQRSAYSEPLKSAVAWLQNEIWSP